MGWRGREGKRERRKQRERGVGVKREEDELERRVICTWLLDVCVPSVR